jgi:hypothetical protein
VVLAIIRPKQLAYFVHQRIRCTAQSADRLKILRDKDLRPLFFPKRGVKPDTDNFTNN